MVAIDTNVLVRFLTNDHPQQSPRARALLEGNEVFVALSGALDVVIDGEEVHLGAGDTLTVPAGTPFSLHNRSGKPARLLACTTAGMQALVNDKVLNPPWTI